MIDDARTPGRSANTRLATNLRRLRIARQLSGAELARATGVSKATLSSIENGHANPTVDTLERLAGALRVTLAELLAELPVPDVEVVRASQGAVPADDGSVVRVLQRLASDPAGKGIGLCEVELPAGYAREHVPMPDGSRIGIYVLAGSVIAGPVERSTELATGDWVGFPADVPYVIESRTRPARLLRAEPVR